MQTTKHEVAAVAAASEQGDSLERNSVSFYLAISERYYAHAEALKALFLKRRKDTPERDALWTGHCRVTDKANVFLIDLRDRGGLLFFGQPKAVAAAQEIEEQLELTLKQGGAA